MRSGLLRVVGRGWAGAWLLVAAALAAGVGRAQDRVETVCALASPADLAGWEVGSGTPSSVAADAGGPGLQLAFDPKGEYHPVYLSWQRPRRDWSAFDALQLDVTNPGSEPVEGYLLVGDQAWLEKGRSYWNRHNSSASFWPGRTVWTIPVRGLFRGEAGSRNNDIKRNIDPDSIVRVDFGFGVKGREGRVVIANLRLVKVERPAGVWAFDFGPPSQAVMLGWTPVAHDTAFTPQRGHGWGAPGGTPWDGADRDTTFGPPLLQDFCEAGGYTFRTAVPPGRYRATVWFESSGYWGGEQAMHRERRIVVGGRAVWQETRPDGPAHPLYRFEEVEPVGADLWDTYMATELAKPAVFEADAGPEGLALRFESDRVWGAKVAGLAVYRDGDAAAAAWVAGEQAKLAAEFRARAVCLDPPARPPPAPAAWGAVVAWPVRIEDEVTPGSVWPADVAVPADLSLSRVAVRGEFEPFCLAVRPRIDLGECRLVLEGFGGGNGEPAGRVQVVRYNTSRGFSSLAYRVRAFAVREQATVALPAGVTRQVLVTVRTGTETAPGEYRGRLSVLRSDGRVALSVPLTLSVRSVVLERETDFAMGFFGLLPPEGVGEARHWEVLEQTLVLLREHGMNSVSGGPSFALQGWTTGQPQVDYGDMDRFFALLRRHGFSKPLNGYGGARFDGLHQGYQKGDVAAEVERRSGLPYPAALLRAWQAVDDHAKSANWPTILYAMCDETRVRETAERELEFMKLMGEVSRTYPRTVRTSGSYSVDFGRRPTEPGDLLYWHQRFFAALDISSLNGHDESVLAEARKLGREVHIYNQGTDRYTFGLYQWSEFRQGVRARWQWHLSALHGYQFFDLDGREPDPAMVCYGRAGLYPTLDFERCREGAEDFYLYQTLQRAVERAREAGREAAAAPAARLLDELTGRVRLNQREPPPGFDADADKLRVIAAIEALAGAR